MAVARHMFDILLNSSGAMLLLFFDLILLRDEYTISSFVIAVDLYNVGEEEISADSCEVIRCESIGLVLYIEPMIYNLSFSG